MALRGITANPRVRCPPERHLRVFPLGAFQLHHEISDWGRNSSLLLQPLGILCLCSRQSSWKDFQSKQSHCLPGPSFYVSPGLQEERAKARLPSSWPLCPLSPAR